MIPDYMDRRDLLKWLHQNKRMVIHMKRNVMKCADGVVYAPPVEKAAAAFTEIPDGSVVRAITIMNTTNIMDSHQDVHLPGLWNKSLREMRSMYLMENHGMAFKSVITDEVKAYTQDMSWVELGENYSGRTQALVFDNRITPDWNKAMYDLYRKGKVREHSVGMRYVKIEFAMDSEDKADREEKDRYEKHLGDIVNAKEVQEQGYYFVVHEAKLIEGSAVVKGSNHVTPTYGAAAEGTPIVIEPPTKGTRIDFDKLAREVRIFNN